MQTALNAQKCQYEQMLSEMKSKHTNNIKRIAQLENELSFHKTKVNDFSSIKQELNTYGEDLQRVINESKEKDAMIEQLKRKLQLMQMNSNNKGKCSCVNDNENDYKRKYEIVVEQNEKLQESAEKLQEMAEQLVSTLQTTKEKYEMKIQQQQNEIEKYKQQHNSDSSNNTGNTMQLKDDEIIVKKEELSKILEANSNLVEMNELMMKKMDMINEIDPMKIVAEINSLKEENEYLKSQLQQQHVY